MNIFLDLDGPVLDNSTRLYSLYADLLKSFGKKPLSMRKYWALKRDCMPEKKIIAKSGIKDTRTINTYMKKREKQIESRCYLRKNELTSGVKDALGFLQKKGNLFIVTTRRIRKNLIWELKEKNIKKFFCRILSGFEKNIPAGEVKADMIKKSGLAIDGASVIIGDTEAEIACGKSLDLFSVAVANGIRKKERLFASGARVICKDIQDVVRKWPEINKKVKI